MPDDRTYRPGTFWRIDDRSGFKVRNTDTRKQWNGLIVRKDFYENRNAQELVTGVRDDQTVPDARPRQKDRFVLTTTYVTAPVAARSAFLPVASAVGFSVGSYVQVTMDDGSPVYAFVVAISGSTLQLSVGPSAAISGMFENQVLLVNASVPTPLLATQSGVPLETGAGFTIQAVF